MSLCHCVCLSVCLSVCHCVCLSVCLSVIVFVRLSLCLFVCHCVCLSVCLSVIVSVCLSLYVYICLSVILSVRLSVCLSVHNAHCVQERDLKTFHEGLKQDLKLMKQSVEMLPKDVRKDVLRQRKEEKDLEQTDKVRTVIVCECL